MTQIDEKHYLESFRDKEAALKHALEIRKFEIDLYWKRAAYFWTFIGASLAAYGLVATKSERSNPPLLVPICCLGFLFSLGWFLGNKGSKLWQENWENHVGMLEDHVFGPLYKTVLVRPLPHTSSDRTPLRVLRRWTAYVVSGPGEYSVSQINQVLSLTVTLLWVVLLYRALDIHMQLHMGRLSPHSPELILTLGSAVYMLFCSRTHMGDHKHQGLRRTVGLIDPSANHQQSQR